MATVRQTQRRKRALDRLMNQEKNLKKTLDKLKGRKKLTSFQKYDLKYIGQTLPRIKKEIAILKSRI